MWKRRRPDALTPREHEVLSLIRVGLTNEEMAQRLGITVAGAKYHVSQILSKLGVATREEAAVVAIQERRTWWAAWPFWAKIAAVATAAAATTAILAFAWTILHRDGEEQSTADRTEAGPAVTLSSPEADACTPIGNTASSGGGIKVGWLAPGVLCWAERSDESGYLVQGSIIYWVCDARGYAGHSDDLPLSISLPADSSRFRLPESPDPRLTSKHFRVLISTVVQGPQSLLSDHVSGRDEPCTVQPYERSVIGSHEDTNGFRPFAAELDAAIQSTDITWFLDNTRFEDFPCDQGGFPARPRACGEAFNSATIPAVIIGIINSEGYGADRAEYEDFLRAYLVDADKSSVDRFGDGTARLHSVGIHAPYVGLNPNRFEALVTSIPQKSASETQAAQPLQRAVIEFHVQHDGRRWVIDSLSRAIDETTLDFDLDPAGGGWETGWSGPLWAFWQRWEEPPAP